MTCAPDVEVLVVGAGPTGLLLAGELTIAGVTVTVADQQHRRGEQSRALGLQPRSAEILDQRGWLTAVAEQALTTVPAGHFAGIELDYSELDTRFPYQLGVEQAIVEAHLERRFGPVARGHRLVALDQDDELVTATFDVDGVRRVLTARYLVGADGGHSTVRKLLGAEFPGRDGRINMAVADVVLADPAADWKLPSFAGLDPVFAHQLPLRDGKTRVLFAGPEQQAIPRAAPVTVAEVERALGRPVRTLCCASRFTDASRQAADYRHGRVLLAGDAAHIHLPIGGQGLNLGLGDASNLGWKLAAQLTGRAPAGLLDTYHAERHPVAAATLASARAQGVLTVPDEDIAALREFVAVLVARPEVHRQLAEHQAGLDVRYPMPAADHPLLGRRMPDPGGRLSRHLHPGKPVLLDSSTRFDHVLSHVDSLGLSRYDVDPGHAVLVRPDGHVCWIGADEAGLRAAVATWFSPTASAPPPTRPGSAARRATASPARP
jgi:2-polyprenyl-6-methoxyphenol hydroxylase-like FAD-dependent oxidoreductase